MPELFTLDSTKVLVGVMYQFFGTSWDLDMGKVKFLMLLKHLAHALRIDATEEQVQEYVDMVGDDMFWHVCDALWKEGKLEPFLKAPGNTHGIVQTLEFESVFNCPECTYLTGEPCVGLDGCRLGACKDTGDTPPKGKTPYTTATQQEEYVEGGWNLGNE